MVFFPANTPYVVYLQLLVLNFIKVGVLCSRWQLKTYSLLHNLQAELLQQHSLRSPLHHPPKAVICLELSCPLTSENTSDRSQLSAQHRIHLKAPHITYKALYNLCAPVPYRPPPMTLPLPPLEIIRCQPSDPHHRAAAHLGEERLCCCCCLEPPPNIHNSDSLHSLKNK